jgi:hypothetical protein
VSREAKKLQTCSIWSDDAGKVDKWANDLLACTYKWSQLAPAQHLAAEAPDNSERTCITLEVVHDNLIYPPHFNRL